MEAVRDINSVGSSATHCRPACTKLGESGRSHGNHFGGSLRQPSIRPNGGHDSLSKFPLSPGGDRAIKVADWPPAWDLLLHRKRINADTEGREQQGIRHGGQGELLHFDFGLLADDIHGGDLVGRHSPEMTVTAELGSVNCELQLLLGVQRIQHSERERFAVLTKRRVYIQRIGVAAGIDRRLVAARGESRSECRNISWNAQAYAGTVL